MGLRARHHAHILEHWPAVDWFEAISDNVLHSQGRPREVLMAVAERYPIVLHGVGLSIGSSDPLDADYLQRLRHLRDTVKAAWVSDHLCWCGVHGRNSHDLLPMPLTQTSLQHTADRVKQVQDAMGAPLLLENPSTYVASLDDHIPEWDFLAQLAEKSDCALLLDVNNIVVSAHNHGFDPASYMDGIPWDRVVQLHVAGHDDRGEHLVDTHRGPVLDRVWDLLAEARKRSGASVLLEWDTAIPDFAVVDAELQRGKTRCEHTDWAASNA